MKEQVLKIYPKAYYRKHGRRTWFETEKNGIYSDVTVYQYIIVDGETSKFIGTQLGYRWFSNEHAAWEDAWNSISKSMMDKFEK